MMTFYFRLFVLLFSISACCLLLLFFQSNCLKKSYFAAVPFKTVFSCKTCKENDLISILLRNYTSRWRKHEPNFKEFRSSLNKCNASFKAVVTQANTPVGSKLVYDGEPTRFLNVKQDLFSTFVKKSPFEGATRKSCAVVGNGGILANSSCGQKIDSSSFVIRCNLPPLGKELERDVGKKTDVVTGNPTIFLEKFKGLDQHRRPFVESLRPYGNGLLLLPAFSFGFSTSLCLKVYYTLDDFDISDLQAIFVNPDYLTCLESFWKGRGVQETRLSSGLMMASLALELCDEVHLYGFWPFKYHPATHQELTNHYYDDRKVSFMHKMPTEFEFLLRLHTTGVIHLHLGECPMK